MKKLEILVPQEGEEWKDISGYEGIYQISSFGRVLSIPRKGTKGGIVRPSYSNSGYLQVHLCKDRVVETHQVHRLVAKHFLENHHEYPEVNHKDENKSNNCVENLEWCTRLYNVRYGSGIKRMAQAHDYQEVSIKSVMHHDYAEIAKKEAKPVLQLSTDGRVIRKWNSVRAAARHFKSSAGNIVSACRGKYKTACGYQWAYAEVDV